jgi:predicted transcriptional regulator
MKLSEYLQEYNLTPGKLAAKAGINPCSVYKILEGNKDSRASILMKISLVTKRKVTMEEMVNMEKVKEKAIRKKKVPSIMERKWVNKEDVTNFLPKSTKLVEKPLETSQNVCKEGI